MENRASNKVGKCGVYVCPTGVEDTSDYFSGVNNNGGWKVEEIEVFQKQVILA